MNNGEQIKLPASNYDKYLHAITLVGLGAISIGAFSMQKVGLTHDLDQPGKSIIESMSHPALGYAGAWIGYKIASYKNNFGNNEAATTLVGASTINFLTEHLQSKIISSTEANYLALSNFPETAKDYVFALGGLLFFSINQKRKAQANQNKTEQ